MPVVASNLASQLLDGALARGQGERIALREGGSSESYRGLQIRVARIADVLRSRGVRSGDRVAVLMPDSIDAAATSLAALWIGAVAVPVSELARGIELRAVLADSGASVAIVHESRRATIEAERGGLPELRAVIGAGRPDAELEAAVVTAAQPSAVDVPPHAIAWLLYSAGARGTDDTGRRGVPHRHATPLAVAHGFADVVALGPEDRVFSLGRLWTAYGLSTGLIFPLAAGAESLLLPAQPHTADVLTALIQGRPTVMFATPSIYAQLTRDALEAGRIDRPLAGLRACVSAAETTPGKVIERCRDVLGAELIVGYGLTEALGLVLAGPGGGRPGACGRPVVGFEVRVVDGAGAPVGPDEIGTLELRGSSIAPAYWRSAKDAIDADGWFRTPDRFLVASDGEHVHCGRDDQLFKVGGKWVAPAEVERALLGHEAVWECAVIGADDEDGFPKPLAFVVANVGHAPSPALEAALREWVKRELSPYKYPRWIEFVGELPKGPHGKILRHKLRDLLRGSRRTRRAESLSDL